jgi:integrase
MITTYIVFDHRGRSKAGQEGPLEVRLTQERKPYYINTGIKITGRQLRDGQIVGRGDADILNERLKMVVRNIEQAVNNRIENGLPIDVAEIRREAYGMKPAKDVSKTGMLEWIAEEVPHLNISAGTRRRYDVLVNRLRLYGKLTAWDDLTVENIYKFDAWLHQLPAPQSNGDIQAGRVKYIKDSAVYNYHRTLGAMLSRAVKFGIIEHNPYERLRGEFRRGMSENTEYLSEEEIAAIESLHPMEGTQMAMARDLFIFQMYTGIAYVDTQRFDATQYREVDGKWKFIGERVKTGVPYVSMLLPPVVEVLKKYDWHVPKMNNQKYNQLLKAIGMVIGIERLHSHMGRHTFGTWMLSNGAKIENVSRMMGHTNITQTQRYAKVLAKDVYDDFERVAKKMKKE